MSLVGTRPPTVDEWELYEPHHRARMSFRPGLTGMWQVSGRSNITDFEEVVKLDTQYISEWSLRLDVKILWKPTVEMLQLLLRLGTFQLSDIFYNTVGGVLGGLMYCAVMKVRKRL